MQGQNAANQSAWSPPNRRWRFESTCNAYAARTSLLSYLYPQVDELRSLLRRHGYASAEMKALRKSGLLELIETLTDMDDSTDTNPNPQDQRPHGAAVVVVIQVYAACKPILPVKAAISVVIEKDADGLWFAKTPLDFTIVWPSSSARVLGVLDISLDPHLAAFFDKDDTEAGARLVRKTVAAAGSSGDFKADKDSASGKANVPPDAKSSELRAATMEAREANKLRGEAEKKQKVAEKGGREKVQRRAGDHHTARSRACTSAD
jgi:hypothetical protein